MRLFLAVEVSTDLRAALLAHLEASGLALPGSVVTPENWHITLRFIGKTDAVTRDRILANLDENLDVEPFRVRFGGVGAFPRPARATVAWLAIRSGGDELPRLAEHCETAVTNAGLLGEERPYHPHLTLSRIRPAHDIRRLVDDFPPFPGVLDVGAVTMFRSHLAGNRPAVYEVIERVEL